MAGSGQGRIRPPVVLVSVLGLLTIVAYGTCYYAYGVLIGPIRASTRWPDAALGAIFSAILIITGAGGIVAGRVLDRRGPRPLFLAAAVAGTVALLVASVQNGLWPFAVTYAAGCGLVGALGFYHITQATAARASPQAPARAIIWLTLFGAFSSPVFLPLTGWLVQTAGWRGAIRIEAVLTGAAFVVAAVLITIPGGPQPSQTAGQAADVLRQAWRSPPLRAWLPPFWAGRRSTPCSSTRSRSPSQPDCRSQSLRRSAGSAAWPSWPGGCPLPG